MVRGQEWYNKEVFSIYNKSENVVERTHSSCGSCPVMQTRFPHGSSPMLCSNSIAFWQVKVNLCHVAKDAKELQPKQIVRCSKIKNQLPPAADV